MNSSDSPATIEEQWTAYLDGRMRAKEVAAFEQEHLGAAAEKAQMTRIMQAVARHCPAPVLRNTEFFNRQILDVIAPGQTQSGIPTASPRSLWSLWRMAIAGACCMAAAAAIYVVFVQGSDQRRSNYVAQVLSVRAGDDDLDATVLDAEGLAVVWIDGLEQLPNDYVLE